MRGSLVKEGGMDGMLEDGVWLSVKRNAGQICWEDAPLSCRRHQGSRKGQAATHRQLCYGSDIGLLCDEKLIWCSRPTARRGQDVEFGSGSVRDMARRNPDCWTRLLRKAALLPGWPDDVVVWAGNGSGCLPPRQFERAKLAGRSGGPQWMHASTPPDA
jgi:hypothetical protein